jgi:hypothetical protein
MNRSKSNGVTIAYAVALALAGGSALAAEQVARPVDPAQSAPAHPVKPAKAPKSQADQSEEFARAAAEADAQSPLLMIPYMNRQHHLYR